MPTGFIYVVIHIFRFHHANGCYVVIHTVAVRIGHIVALYPTLNVIFGNVKPKTYSTCVLKLNSFTVYAKSDPSVIAGVRFLGRKTVYLQTHRIITVVYLTIGTICQRQVEIVITIVVSSAVDNVPNIDISLACLKIPKYFRACAQLKRNADCGLVAHIQGSGYGAGNIRRSRRFTNSAEIQPTNLSKSSISCGKCNIVCAKTDLLRNIANQSRSLYRDLCRFTERNGNNRLIEENRVRRNDGDNLFANNVSFVYHLSSYSTFSAVGLKHTVFDGTHTVFFNLPLCISRNINLGAYCIGAECAKGNAATGGVVRILRFYLSACKLTV